MFQKFKVLFALHSELEDKILYKQLIEIPELHPLILKAKQSHHVANAIFIELRVLSFATESWLPKFLVFTDHLCRDMEEKEDLIFKKAANILTTHQLKELEIALKNFVKERKA